MENIDTHNINIDIKRTIAPNCGSIHLQILKQDMKNVLVVGVFDLFHRGHLELLRQARQFGDQLFVVVNGDKLTGEYKRTPVFCEDDRKALVESVRFVDVAIISNEFDVKPIVEEFSINVIVHGDDWPHEQYLKQIRVTEQYLIEKNIEMIYLKYRGGISTSGIIKTLKEA